MRRLGLRCLAAGPSSAPKDRATENARTTCRDPREGMANAAPCKGHPNEKPVELMMRLCAKVPGLILDPCMGSGSTGVAAIKLGRKFIGCEVVPEYFEIACERIAAAWSQPRLFADDESCSATASVAREDGVES